MFGIAEDTGPGFSVRNEKREGWSGVEGAECDRWGPASYRGFGDFKTRAVSENLSSGLSSGMCGECPSTTPVGILCCMWLRMFLHTDQPGQGDDDFELGTPEVCLEVEGVSAVRTSRETGVAGCLRLVQSRPGRGGTWWAGPTRGVGLRLLQRGPGQGAPRATAARKDDAVRRARLAGVRGAGAAGALQRCDSGPGPAGASALRGREGR